MRPQHAGAGGSRGHDKASATRFVQVAPEVGNPEVITVEDCSVLVHSPRQTKGLAARNLLLPRLMSGEIEG